MLRRRLVLGCLFASSVGGCWAEEARVDGFTADQWAGLQEKFAIPALDADRCHDTEVAGNVDLCNKAALLGQMLFFNADISVPLGTSCATCHDPKADFADPRIPNNARSITATGGLTKRNTISVVNLAYKPPGSFTWIGMHDVREVILNVALPKAMNATSESIVYAITRTQALHSQFIQVFGVGPNVDYVTKERVAMALDVYMRRLISVQSPFDLYIAGDRDALDERARRGFELFVGKAMCVECHSGHTFSDSNGHVTGVQKTEDVDDQGQIEITKAADDLGKYITPPLRNVTSTGPYMHAGSHETLSEVLDFYRWGGNDLNYLGDKDSLIEPLDLTDDDLRDLESFLHSLTGQPIDGALTMAPQ